MAADTLPGPEPEPVRVGRERILARLRQATSSGRLTLVLGPAGCGKTTAMSLLAEEEATAWYVVPHEGVQPSLFARGLVDALRLRVAGLPRSLSELGSGLESADPADRQDRADTFAAFCAEALADSLHRDLLLVVDGVERLENPSSLGLLEALTRHIPKTLHLILAGRVAPALRIERLAEQGEVATLTDRDLMLLPEDLVDLAGALGGGASTAGGLPAPLHPDTAVLTRALLAGASAGEGSTLDGVVGAVHPETAVLTTALLAGGHPPAASATPRDLATALLDALPEDAREVVEAVAAVGPIQTGVLSVLLGRPAAEPIAALTRQGLVRPVGHEPGTVEVGAAVAQVLPLDATVRSRWCTKAAIELEANGDVHRALRLHRRAGDESAVLDLIERQGRTLLTAGLWEVVLEAMGNEQDLAAIGDPSVSASDGSAPLSWASPELAGLAGEAWRLAGDWDRALRWFNRAIAGRDTSAWLAWRMGVILYLRGELDEAQTILSRAGEDGTDADRALVAAWYAATAWAKGDTPASRSHSEEAMALARRSGDDRALAGAHTVWALLAAVEGDRGANDRHYLQALEHAERVGDLVQVVRIQTNRGSALLEEGDHADALAILDEALRTAELSGAIPFHGMALSNRGEVLERLGRLDEAVADLRSSRRLFERESSRMVAYPLAALGRIYFARGDRSLARAAYEEALAQAEPVADVQGVVPALSGLALVLVDEERDQARELAERAAADTENLGHVQALASLAAVALEQGDREAAVDAIQRGLTVARSRRDRPGIAQLLELSGLAADDHDRGRSLLEEARALWQAMDSPLEAARVEVRLAGRLGGTEGVALAERAATTLRTLGARTWADEAARTIAELEAQHSAGVRIQVLGGFRLWRQGEPMPSSEWQSRKARDLLKILVLRQGRPTTREALMELLWPEDEPAKLANRLSVALTTVRGVLDPDRATGDGPVTADGEVVALDPSRIDIDLNEFTERARQGLRRFRARDLAGAEPLLAAAEARYTGDLLEEDPYSDWAVGVREEARATYIEVVSALVDIAAWRGDDLGAVRLLLRLIERDPYDEGAHLRLVETLERSGRRGEARRRYQVYAARMHELDVQPAPFPQAAFRVP